MLVAAAALALPLTALACSNDDSVFNFEEGTCIESLAGAVGPVSELPTVECDVTHEAEVVALVTHTGDDFDSGRIEDEGTEGCSAGFEDYVGAPIQLTTLDMTTLSPTSESWDQGDRETVCIATGDDLEESLEGASDDFAVDIDPEFADLVDSCMGGNDADCDTLFQGTPIGSVEEQVGGTCGFREDGSTAGSCAG